jgi:hypothetical protein
MMPDLPKQNKHKEAEAGIVFRSWLKDNPQRTATFEMKYAHANNSLPFSEVKPEQLTYALAVRSDKGVLMRTDGVRGMPDYVYLRGEPSYIVVKFRKCFVLIDPETWLLESKRSKRRSLTEARAREISNLTIQL